MGRREMERRQPTPTILLVPFPPAPDLTGGVGSLMASLMGSPLIIGGTIGQAKAEDLATDLVARSAIIEFAARYAAWLNTRQRGRGAAARAEEGGTG